MPVSAASRSRGASSRWWTKPDGREGSSEDERPVVLFVEDHPMVRWTLAERLFEEGFAVVQCETGEDAVALLAGQARIHALLTDLRLPGFIDGWDVAEIARRHRRGLPVVYVSAYAYASARQVPGSVMLDKPAAPEVVIDALDNLLG